MTNLIARNTNTYLNASFDIDWLSWKKKSILTWFFVYICLQKVLLRTKHRYSLPKCNTLLHPFPFIVQGWKERMCWILRSVKQCDFYSNCFHEISNPKQTKITEVLPTKFGKGEINAYHRNSTYVAIILIYNTNTNFDRKSGNLQPPKT